MLKDNAELNKIEEDLIKNISKEDIETYKTKSFLDVPLKSFLRYIADNGHEELELTSKIMGLVREDIKKKRPRNMTDTETPKKKKSKLFADLLNDSEASTSRAVKIVNQSRKAKFIASGWKPFNKIGKKDDDTKVIISCYCQKPMVRRVSNFNCNEYYFSCESPRAKSCGVKLTYSAIDLLYSFCQTKNYEVLPLYRCDCDQANKYMIYNGSQDNVKQKKIWMKCMECATSFLPDDISSYKKNALYLITEEDDE